MSKFKYIFSLFFVATLLACQPEKVETTAISILIDITDERFQDENFMEENLSKFLKLMKLDKEKGGYGGGEIKFSLINEVSDSKSLTTKIVAGKTGMMGENPLTRKDEVNRFCAETEKVFSTIMKKANWGTNASKIYQKVARECLKMKRIDADRKVLIIYSDMLENSNLFSFYSSGWQKNIDKLMATPNETLEKFGKKAPVLPDLSEFEIRIITSRTAENDEKINVSEQFWITIFEHQGATVTFNSTLDC